MTSIPAVNRVAIFDFAALSALGAVKPLVGSVSCDNPSVAYGGYQGTHFVVVPKVVPAPGVSVPVNFTVNGISNGIVLPPKVYQFTIDGPVDPDPAVQIDTTFGINVIDSVGFPVPVDTGAVVPIQ